MALDRRVEVSVPRQRTKPDADESLVDGPVAPARQAVEGRLDHVPTQRGPLPERADDERAGRRPGRTALVVGALAVSAALVVTSGVIQHQRAVRQEERLLAAERVAAAVSVLDADAQAPDGSAAGGEAAWEDAVVAARDEASAAASGAAAVLEATPHAGDEARVTLQTAADAVATTASDPAASLTALRAAAATLAGPTKAAQDAETAWQEAEAARIAAEQAAAEKAAAEKAAAAATKKGGSSKSASSGTKRSSSGATAPAAGGAPAEAPAAPSTPTIPSGGLVCPGAPSGGGAGESSVDAIGAAINEYRQSQGLGALSVSRSGTLVGHAQNMAAAGGIWHSGKDNIVGCTSGSVGSLLNAWAHSSSHNAQMLRTDVSSMSVGGASGGGWLYGAVKFS